VLVNVHITRGARVADDPHVRDAVAAAEKDLTGRGRVLLRPSGTEPLMRVMVEGEDEARVRSLAESIAAVVRRVAGASHAK
jgi:phosphoglucosamine mutase